MALYEVDDATDTTVDADDTWIATIKEDVLCPECGALRSGHDVLDLVIGEVSGRFAIGCVLPLCAMLMHTGFVDAIGKKEVERAMYLRNVFRADGRVHSEYVAAYGREPTYIRASERSHHSVCQECGHSAYFGVGSRYTTKAAMANGLDIYEESGARGLIMTDTLFDRLDETWRKLLKCYKLPVKVHAIDGLPDVWPTRPSKELLAGYVPHRTAFRTSRLGRSSDHG